MYIKRKINNFLTTSKRLLRSLYNFKYYPLINSRIPYRIYQEKDADVFFGYYDVSPFRGYKLLSNYRLNSNDVIEVGFFDLESDFSKFISLGKTETWNLQMGCRLQWHPLKHNYFFYNKLLSGKYGSVMIDIDDIKNSREIEYPIYTLSDTYNLLLSLDFSRLETMREGYGYHNLNDETKNVHIPDLDAIILYDYNSNEIVRKLSYSDLMKDINDKKVFASYNYVNHLNFQPKTKNFIFQHCILRDKKKEVRLLYYNFNEDSLDMLCDFNFVCSHFNWINNDKLLMYLYKGPRGAGYYILTLSTKDLSFLSDAPNKKDGHPTYFGSSYFVSDTVPNSFSERDLFIYDIVNRRKIDLASIYSSPKYTGSERCDLHPRMAEENKLLSVDCIIGNRRNQIVFDLTEKLNVK